MVADRHEVGVSASAEDRYRLVGFFMDELGDDCVGDVMDMDDGRVSFRVYRDYFSDDFMDSWAPVITGCEGGEVHLGKYYYTVIL